MARLQQFSDHVIMGKWARFTMADNSPCYLAIGPRSIVIKKSISGIFGPIIYEVRNTKVIETIIDVMIDKFPDDVTPEGMTNRILKPVVNAVLHCDELEQVVSLFDCAAHSNSCRKVECPPLEAAYSKKP